MTGGAWQWALSALFAAVGAWYLAAGLRVLRDSGMVFRALISPGLHVLMSVAMIGMLWPWGAAIPVITQVTVFTTGAAWFAAHALFSIGHAGRRYLNWYHAAMMAAMVWMPVVMGVLPASGPAALTTAQGAAVPAASMSGMAGMTGMAGMAPAMPSGPAVGWAGPACATLAVAFAAAAACYLVAVLRPVATAGYRIRAVSLLSHGAGVLMAAGMAVVLLEMA